MTTTTTTQTIITAEQWQKAATKLAHDLTPKYGHSYLKTIMLPTDEIDSMTGEQILKPVKVYDMPTLTSPRATMKTDTIIAFGGCLETVQAYYTLNKVIKRAIATYPTLYQNNRSDFHSIIVETLISLEITAKDDRKAVLNRLFAGIQRHVRNELKTVSDRHRSSLAMSELKKEYKRLKETAGEQTAKTFWSNFSDNYKLAYQQVMIEDIDKPSNDNVERVAINNVLLGQLLKSEQLTRVERETLKSILAGTFETGRDKAGKTQQKKLERLIEKAKTILL
jgi:hypothetical protein